MTWGTSAGGSKALITALTESDFLPGEVSGPGTEHTVIGAISFFGATTYVVPELWQKRLERFPSRSQSKAEMMLKPSDGMSPEEIQKLVSADQHLKSNSPPILLVHGDNDPVVPIELSKHLHEVAKAQPRCEAGGSKECRTRLQQSQGKFSSAVHDLGRHSATRHSASDGLGSMIQSQQNTFACRN